jgi:hypothetical protein
MQLGKRVRASDIEALRVLLNECAKADDCTSAICYHGAAAIIANTDGNKVAAIRHREIEIRKIKQLHREEIRNPPNGYATQNYGVKDLNFRLKILNELKNAG